MYYRVLTVEFVLTFTLCISVKPRKGFLCNVQDYEVLCDSTLYLYLCLDFVYWYWYWYLHLLYLFLYLMT